MLRSILDAPFLAGAAGELFQLKLRSIAADTPLGAAGAFAQVLGGDASARMQAFGSLYAHAKKTGAIVGEGHPGGPGFIKTSMVRGALPEPPVEVSHRPVAAIRLEDAWVTGHSGIARVGDMLLADGAPVRRARTRWAHGTQGARAARGRLPGCRGAHLRRIAAARDAHALQLGVSAKGCCHRGSAAGRPVRTACATPGPANGAGGRTRTDTLSPETDFESVASTIPPHPRGRPMRRRKVLGL